MKCAKIIVKSNYEQRGDLVLRSYVRALEKAHANVLLDGNNGLICGLVDENGKFHEYFTNMIIDYDDYVIVPFHYFANICFLPVEEETKLRQIMEKVLFNKDNDLDMEISSIEELARDRAVEFDAYDKCFSRINPYQRISTSDVESYNDYNDFLVKVRECKKMHLIDHKNLLRDEYEVHSYVPKPENEEDYEYLTFEVPKVLKK